MSHNVGINRGYEKGWKDEVGSSLLQPREGYVYRLEVVAVSPEGKYHEFIGFESEGEIKDEKYVIFEDGCYRRIGKQ